MDTTTIVRTLTRVANAPRGRWVDLTQEERTHLRHAAVAMEFFGGLTFEQAMRRVASQAGDTVERYEPVGSVIVRRAPPKPTPPSLRDLKEDGIPTRKKGPVL
jgi:hypothetical protein